MANINDDDDMSVFAECVTLILQLIATIVESLA